MNKEKVKEEIRENKYFSEMGLFEICKNCGPFIDKNIDFYIRNKIFIIFHNMIFIKFDIKFCILEYLEKLETKIK